MNLIRKSILARAVLAVAISLSGSAAFAKTSHKAKEPPCSFGQACTNKPAKLSQATGWVTVQRCSYEGHKMYADVFPCYQPGGMCPAAACKAKK